MKITFILIGVFLSSLLVLFFSNKLSRATNNRSFKYHTFLSIVTAAIALTGVAGGYFVFENGFDDVDNSSIYFSVGSLVITFFLSFFIQILSSLDQLNNEEKKTVAKDIKILEYEKQIEEMKREIDIMKKCRDISKIDLDNNFDEEPNTLKIINRKEKFLIALAFGTVIIIERLRSKRI